MDVATPEDLENGILNLDGRVGLALRGGGDAWRAFTVFRWREEAEGMGPAGPLGDDGELDLDMLATMDRGGRDNHGTLHYLRGCCEE
jgi:hypothetical protein